MQFEAGKFKTIFFRYIMGLSACAMLVGIGMYAYLGTFSRYLSDDYCEAVATKNSVVGGVVQRYMDGQWRAANRTSNLLFVGITELIGKNNMPITTAAMVILWPVGLSWSVYEFRKFFKVNWSVQTDCFLGSTLGFFILFQAPNLFQTIYWRSSMMTHFAPLVFGTFLFAFWMKQAGRALNDKIYLWVYLIIFFITFIVAGFSEPPVTTMVTALALFILAVRYFMKPPARDKLLALLAWTFAGALLGLLVMAFSPAIKNMVGKSAPSLFVLFRDSFLFSFIFITFSFKQLPLPNILTILIPALLVWFHKQQTSSEDRQVRIHVLWIIFLLAPIVMWVLIAAGFSPSVYGQGFPVERMRFLARAIMTATLMFEGVILGSLLQNVQFKSNRMIGQWIALAVIGILGIIYPLRATLNIYRVDVPEYQSRAQLWDLRNAYIIRHASLGEKDIVVPGYPGVHSVKELDDDPQYWVNLCAAKFYGVNSIHAVSMPDTYILGYLNE